VKNPHNTQNPSIIVFLDSPRILRWRSIPQMNLCSFLKAGHVDFQFEVLTASETSVMPALVRL